MNVNTDFSRFADLVLRMRLAQQQRNRNGKCYVQAQHLERQVDEAVTEILRIRPTNETQMSMFDSTPVVKPGSALANGQ